MRLQPEQLAEIERVTAKATPGEWLATKDVHGPDLIEFGVWSDVMGEYVAELVTSEAGEADAVFIATARAAMPLLVAEVYASHAETCEQAQQIANLEAALARRRFASVRLVLSSLRARRRKGERA